MILLIGYWLSATRKFPRGSGFFLSGFALCLVLFFSDSFQRITYFETDFSEYCIAVSNFGSWDAMIPPKRSRLATLLAGSLHRYFSTIDALAIGAIISTFISFFSVYGWGKMIGGRRAGLGAVFMLSMLSPFVLLPRFLNFYPEIVAMTLFSAFSVSCFFRYRSCRTALLAGIGVAGVLLIDLRGVVWAGVYSIGIVLGILFSQQGFGKKLQLLGCFILPLYLSWFGAWWSYPSYATSLEKQIDVRPLFVGFDEGNPMLQPPWKIDSHFVWGRTKVQDIGKTLEFLWEQRQIPVPEKFLSWQNKKGEQLGYNSFLMSLFWLTFIPSLLLKKVNRFALLVSVFPFFFMFQSLNMVEAHLRFYLHALPALVVPAGIVMSVWRKKRLLSGWLVFAGFGLILLALFQSKDLTPLSPKADWRIKWAIQKLELQAIQKEIEQGTNNLRAGYQQDCMKIIQKEGQLAPSVYP